MLLNKSAWGGVPAATATGAVVLRGTGAGTGGVARAVTGDGTSGCTGGCTGGCTSGCTVVPFSSVCARNSILAAICLPLVVICNRLLLSAALGVLQ